MTCRRDPEVKRQERYRDFEPGGGFYPMTAGKECGTDPRKTSRGGGTAAPMVETVERFTRTVFARPCTNGASAARVATPVVGVDVRAPKTSVGASGDVRATCCTCYKVLVLTPLPEGRRAQFYNARSRGKSAPLHSSLKRGG